MSLRFFVIFPVRGLIPASVLLSDALTLVVSYPAGAIPVEDTLSAISTHRSSRVLFIYYIIK